MVATPTNNGYDVRAAECHEKAAGPMGPAEGDERAPNLNVE